MLLCGRAITASAPRELRYRLLQRSKSKSTDTQSRNADVGPADMSLPSAEEKPNTTQRAVEPPEEPAPKAREKIPPYEPDLAPPTPQVPAKSSRVAAIIVALSVLAIVGLSLWYLVQPQ